MLTPCGVRNFSLLLSICPILVRKQNLPLYLLCYAVHGGLEHSPTICICAMHVSTKYRPTNLFLTKQLNKDRSKTNKFTYTSVHLFLYIIGRRLSKLQFCSTLVFCLVCTKKKHISLSCVKLHNYMCVFFWTNFKLTTKLSRPTRKVVSHVQSSRTLNQYKLTAKLILIKWFFSLISDMSKGDMDISNYNAT